MTRTQPEDSSVTWYRICAALTGLVLVALNVLRILKVPITFDEAVSYEGQLSYLDIARLKIATSNMHILNSMAIKFFTSLFGGGIFWIRLDSLLAQVVYLWFSYLICKLLFRVAPWRICVFLLLNLWPLLFEFWGLARGYGLAIAFMLGSVYFLLRYVKDGKLLWLNLCLYFAVLAIYGNFTLLIYFCGLLCVSVAVQFSQLPSIAQKGQRQMAGLSILAASFVLLLLLGEPLYRLIDAHEFYYGGTKDIVRDTIHSLVTENTFGLHPRFFYLCIFISIACLLPIISGIYWAGRWRRNVRGYDMYAGAALWLLLAAPLMGIVAQHYLMHTLYPVDRTALFLIPLWVLAINYWCCYATQNKQQTGKLILYAVTVVMAINFISSANIKSSRLWWFGSNDVVVINKIISETKNKAVKNKIHIHWLFNPSFRYYIKTKYGAYFEPVTDYKECNEGVDTSYSYYYAARECLQYIPNIYVVDTVFYNGDFVLMKKR